MTGTQALSGKVALVTGAGRGIGRAVSLAYAAEGAGLILGSRGSDVEETAALARKRGVQVMAMSCDISDNLQVETLVDEALKKFDRIDVLVNNAGVLGPRKPLAENSLADWEEAVRINITGTFLVTRKVLRVAMIPQKSGVILNLSSGLGKRGRALWAAYAVSKFAVEAMTQVLAEEVAPYGIRVNAVNPGATRTRMRAEAYPEEDPRTLKTPEDVASAFVRLASDGAKVKTGESLELNRATGELVT